MEQLKRLALAAREINLKEADLLTVDAKRKSKLNAFYAGLVNGQFASDNEAAEHFYEAAPSHSSYKSLKAKLRNRLINTFFFWEPGDKYSKREKAYAYCIKYAAVGKLLTSLKISGLGSELMKKVFKKAMEYEFTDYILEASFFLRSYYVFDQPDEKQSVYYQDLCRQYNTILGSEIEAGNYLLKLMLPHVNNKSSGRDTLQQALHYHEQLKPYLEKFNSPRLYLMDFHIRSMGYLSVNDYRQTTEVCNQAIRYFENKTYQYKSAVSAFYHQLLVCHTQQKQFPEGKVVAEKTLRLQKPGSYGWFLNLSLYLTLSFHSRAYQESYHILGRALSNRKLKQMPIHLQEKWRICQMYVHFLIFADKIRMEPGDKRFSKVKMGRFLNSVPLFSKDKRGLNIPILVIQILFIILKKDYNRAIDRIEAIEKYCTRYLKKDDNFRSNCFIKMLLQIPISNFHRAGIERRTAKYLERLKAEPLAISNQSHEVEIIPYEDLWEILINALETKTYHPRA